MWRKIRPQHYTFAEPGDGWSRCNLFNNAYDLGWKLPAPFLKKYSEVSVGLHECQEKNVLDEWGDDTKEGNLIFNSSIKSTIGFYNSISLCNL